MWPKDWETYGPPSSFCYYRYYSDINYSMKTRLESIRIPNPFRTREMNET